MKTVEIQHIKAKVYPGGDIYRAIDEMIAIAKVHNCGVTADFNGTELWVLPQSTQAVVAAGYFNARKTN